MIYANLEGYRHVYTVIPTFIHLKSDINIWYIKWCVFMFESVHDNILFVYGTALRVVCHSGNIGMGLAHSGLLYCYKVMV